MRKITVLAVAFALVACDRSRPELEKTLVQVQQISAEKDSLLKDVLATSQFLADVNTEIAKVRSPNAARPTKGQPGEAETYVSPAQQRAQLLAKVKEITTRFNDTESRLAASRKRVAELAGNTTALASQLAAYDSAITSFKAIMENQKAEIVNLTQQVTMLNGQVTELKMQTVQLVSDKTQLTDERDRLTAERNTVFYVVGTKDDLLKKHIIVQTGGTLGLGKSQVAARDLSPSEFTAIDRTKVAEIAFPNADKSYRILTRQDLTALGSVPDKEGRIRVGLRIRDAEQFWGSSKYLILIEQ